jgi:two-component system response regulator RegX3
MTRILIVEDHDPVRRTLASLLQLEGHQVDQAADGRQALARFAAQPCDLVVMDLYMPGLNGLETCRCLRQKSQVPILMISTTRNPAIRKQALGCGANAFLSKPLQFKKLLAWVRRASQAGCGN